jgi:hypothetical protein
MTMRKSLTPNFFFYRPFFGLHNILEPMMGQPSGYSAKHCSKSLLKKDLFLFKVVMLTPPLPHVCFFHFSDTCSLGSNGSTKFLELLLSLIPFQRADPALVLKCYVGRTRGILK